MRFSITVLLFVPMITQAITIGQLTNTPTLNSNSLFEVSMAGTNSKHISWGQLKNQLPGYTRQESFDDWLILPSFDGIESYTHPNLLCLSSNWNGFPFWLTYTPFPDTTREWPHLACSQDLTTWTAIHTNNGSLLTSNDLYQITGWTSLMWAADPEVFVATNGIMHVIAIGVHAPANIDVVVWGKSSADGITWSSPFLLASNSASLAWFAGPQIVQSTNGPLRLYYVDDGTVYASNALYYVEGLDGTGTNWNWGSPQLCTLVTAATNSLTPWHFDLSWAGDRYQLFYAAGSTAHYGEMAESTDGITWGNVISSYWTPAQRNNLFGIYKPTFNIRTGPDGRPAYDFIVGVSAHNVNDIDPTNYWRLKLLRNFQPTAFNYISASADTNKLIIGASGENTGDPAAFRLGRLIVADKQGGTRATVALGTPGSGYGALTFYTSAAMSFTTAALIGNDTETILNSPSATATFSFRQGNTTRWMINASGDLTNNSTTKITLAKFRSPTNAPTAGQVIQATSTRADTAWTDAGINYTGTNLIHTIGTTNGIGPIDSGGPTGTPWSWTNNYNMGNVVCYFNGDDYSSIAKNGVELFTSTPATVLLQPNQYVTLQTNGAGGAVFFYERF